jgi:hypothetical protein
VAETRRASVTDRPAVIYLDVDDEITSAAARIRTADSGRIAVVVPPGSRIATSRINFRLLAREAYAQGRRLLVVAPDAPSRALAASAGLPVYGSVGELESATRDEAAASGAASGEASGEPSGEASGAAAADATAGPVALAEQAADEGTIILPPVPGEGRVAAPAVSPPASPAGPRVRDAAVRTSRPRRSRILAALAGLVLVLLAAGGVAAWVVLPSATVIVSPRYEPVGPISLTIRADPSATAVDATNGVIPAERLSFDLTATSTFKATGTRVQQAAASGAVRWTNCDPTASYRIPAGAVVRTKSGVRFQTTEAVFLPVASISGSPPDITVSCQSNTASVNAVAPGPEGNVGANAITIPPSNYNANVITVTNPDPTSGGARQTFPVVQRKDVDAAQAALRKELSNELDAKLGAPDTTPAGTTLFPTTKKVTNVQPDADPTALVDQEVATFELTLTATGTVIAVDDSPVEQIAAQRLSGSVRPEHTLAPDSVTITTGTPSVSGEIVSFPVRASASQVGTIDAQALRDAIRGRSVDDARHALEQYGSVVITTWPEWVSTIPNLDQRLDLRVGTPAAPAPSASPAASGPIVPTASVAASGPAPASAVPSVPVSASPAPSGS